MTTILIGLGIIIALIIIGKIFSVLTKVLFAIILVIIVGFFIWQNNTETPLPTFSIQKILQK